MVGCEVVGDMEIKSESISGWSCRAEGKTWLKTYRI
jgi:hypothetical protein